MNLTLKVGGSNHLWETISNFRMRSREDERNIIRNSRTQLKDGATDFIIQYSQ